jgi:hypothetical protein
MSRKTKIRTVDLEAGEMGRDPHLEDADPHGFWDRDNLDGPANDDAFAHVIDIGDDLPDEREILVYMGSVSEVDGAELAALGAWAEDKACRGCKRKMRARGDVALLKHDDCRQAFRVSSLLHRYQ